MEVAKKGVVCVTGGTGYVGSWLIMRLLQHGYSVHTPIRGSPDGKKDLSFLTNLPGASSRLSFFTADLDKPKSFEAAIEGCIGVFHVVHPLDFEDKEGEKAIIDKSIKGILGILTACLNSKTVERVIYTSTDSAVAYDDKGLDVVNEESWSDVDFIRSLNTFAASYSISKILTEKAALEFAKEHGVDLVCVNPGWIHGPFITTRCPDSVQVLMAMFFAGENIDVIKSFESTIGLVHVDDVANAHIFLFEHPNAQGRYICCSTTIVPAKLLEFLTKRYPQCHIQIVDTSKIIRTFKYPRLSSQKLLDVGFKFKYGLEEVYDDALECCKQRGFL